MSSLVVARLASFWELLENPPERSHTARNVALLVLRHGVLDMCEDKSSVEFGRLSVVCNCLCEFLHDKVDCEESELTSSK